MVSNMKIASLVVGALAAVAGAQDLSGFPQCAQWCINSMQQANKSQELGCSANDAACACRNQNFLYGVRDCSAELCASFDIAGQAVGYANEYCRNHGVDLQTVTTGLPSQFTNTHVPSGTGTGSKTGAGGGAGAGATRSAVTTSPILSTATENGSTVVLTVGSTTISSGGGAAATGSSATSTVPVVSTVTSGSSTFQTTVGSSTLTTQTTGTGGTTGGTTGGANGRTTGGSGGATTTSNPNYAPQMTAAPAGLLAAAGVAVFLL